MELRTQSVITYGKAMEEEYLLQSPSSSSASSPTELNANSSFSERDYESSCYLMPITPETSPICDENRRVGYVRRGRPKLESITSLIMSGANSPSPIRCNVCKRVFPREKSLQAHLRTHTGERPYRCDYPGCDRRFTQSGQLRTHQRLHTGEKPFVCGFKGCKNAFTHANRHCTLHPEAGVKREKGCALPSVLKVNTALENASEDVVKWIEKHTRSNKRSGTKRNRQFSSQTSADRLRARNFTRELEEIDLKEKEAEVEVVEAEEEELEPVCKKKRAALEYMKSEEKCAKLEEPVITKDKLIGALALMELAGSPIDPPPVTDIGSEIVIHDVAIPRDLRFGLQVNQDENKAVYLML